MSYEIAIVAALLGITFLFAYLSYKLDDSFTSIKFFLMLLTFLFVFVGLLVVRSIAYDNYDTNVFNVMDITYQSYIYIFLFLVFYFVVNFIIQILTTFYKNKREEHAEENQ